MQLADLREFEDLTFDRLYEVNEALALSARVPQPFVPSSERARLRSDLIAEEAMELCTALQNEDLEQVIKESCDLLYVVFGTAVTFGYDGQLERAFRRVHQNNMAKITNGQFREDGKLVKPKGHPKVDLADLAAVTEMKYPE